MVSGPAANPAEMEAKVRQNKSNRGNPRNWRVARKCSEKNFIIMREIFVSTGKSRVGMWEFPRRKWEIPLGKWQISTLPERESTCLREPEVTPLGKREITPFWVRRWEDETEVCNDREEVVGGANGRFGATMRALAGGMRPSSLPDVAVIIKFVTRQTEGPSGEFTKTRRKP